MPALLCIQDRERLPISVSDHLVDVSAKMVSHPEPPGYRRSAPVRRPKLEAHVGFIDEILRTDLEAPRKQRHTVRRIFERLRDERGFDGGYTTVRDYVRPRRRTPAVSMSVKGSPSRS